MRWRIWTVVMALVASACTGGSGDGDGNGTGTDATATTVVDGAGFPVDGEVRRVTLDNGLEVYVRENRTPGANAELRLVVRAGSVHETAEQVGVAHFLEHMMFNGTASFPGNGLVDVLRGFGMEFGADLNASTSYDETVYELSVPTTGAGQLGTGLDVLAEWLSAATLDPAEVAREAGVVLDEWRQREQSYAGRLSDVIEAEYLAGSAYAGHDPIGTDDAIAATTSEQLRAFYDAWYRPDNAAVVVVGDVDADEVIEAITDRFGGLAPRGEPGVAPDTTLPSYTAPSAVVYADPDTAVVEAELTLPSPWTGIGDAADLRTAVVVDLAFELLVTRLSDDLALGEAVYTDAYRSNNSIVRPLDAPSVVLTAAPDDLDATIDALLEEFERVRRFGFDTAELDRVLDAYRADAEDRCAGSGSTSDRTYADDYVEHFLGGGPLMDDCAWRDVSLAIYDTVTTGEVASGFVARSEGAGQHLLLLVPDTVGDVPDEAELLDRMAAMADAEIEPRERVEQGATDPTADGLMARPEPVGPVEVTELAGDVTSFLAPVLLTFANGARVVLNPTEISADQVSMSATSPGGLSLVADADVPEALIAAEVVTASGISDLNPVQLDTVLAATSVRFQSYLEAVEEGMYANSSTSDVETVLQLVHLAFTDPRFEQVALDQVVDSWQPYADDPLADPDLAYFAAYTELRYDGEPRYRAIPTSDELAGLDLATVERVWRERFADPADWVFTFAGDFDVDAVTDLLGRYVGTLPGGVGAAETIVDHQAGPPQTVESAVVRAGTGDKATLTFVYEAELDLAPTGREAVLADVLTGVLTNLLTDRVREQLGASYSPYGDVSVYTEPDELVETVLQVTGAPDEIDAIATVVQDELSALRRDGPDDDELTDAIAAVAHEYDLFDNDTLADLLARAPVHPEELSALVARREVLASIDAADVHEFLLAAMPADRYLDLRLLPA